jgi:acetyl-CoA acetyltransferase
MRDAVIVEALRTPVGKNAGGLAGVHPVALSATVLNALAAKAGIAPDLVDDVVWGCVGQVGDGAFEVNEAFAPVPLAWLADLGADEKQLNVNGGAIALGHPLGGSGARLMTTLVHHMKDNGVRYGLQTMCEGGGLANATILELL